MKETSAGNSNKSSKSDTVHFFQRILVKMPKKVKMFLAIFCSFLAPIVILFFLYPASFELTWKGRTFYLFFLWLIALELLLTWEKFQSKKLDNSEPMRKAILGVALLIPTLYVVVANYFGLNVVVLSLARQFSVPWADWMPLSVEYLVFTMLFVAIMMLAYGFDGLKDFSISALFLGTIGTVYMIDNLYPYGIFAPFQIFVPTTATFAANVLNLMGYQTSLSFIENHPIYGSLPSLEVKDSLGKTVEFGIAWPCSGIQSFFIYTVVMVLFLKKTTIPWMYRIVYFVIGAVVTYFLNILRVATIFIVAINNGDWLLFHNYYGGLYAMIWIIAYPLIIIGSRMLWAKIKPKLGVNNAQRRLFHQPTPMQKS